MGFPRYSLWGDNRIRGGRLGEECAVVRVGKPQEERPGARQRIKPRGRAGNLSCPSPAQSWVGSTGFPTPCSSPKTVPRGGVKERGQGRSSDYRLKGLGRRGSKNTPQEQRWPSATAMAPLPRLAATCGRTPLTHPGRTTLSGWARGTLLPHCPVEEGLGHLACSRFTLSSPVLIVRPWDLVTGLIKAWRNGAGLATARQEQGRGRQGLLSEGVYIPRPNTLRPAPGSWEVRDTSCPPPGAAALWCEGKGEGLLPGTSQGRTERQEKSEEKGWPGSPLGPVERGAARWLAGAGHSGSD